jgi:hypothetical protein
LYVGLLFTMEWFHLCLSTWALKARAFHKSPRRLQGRVTFEGSLWSGFLMHYRRIKKLANYIFDG